MYQKKGKVSKKNVWKNHNLSFGRKYMIKNEEYWKGRVYGPLQKMQFFLKRGLKSSSICSSKQTNKLR